MSVYAKADARRVAVNTRVFIRVRENMHAVIITYYQGVFRFTPDAHDASLIFVVPNVYAKLNVPLVAVCACRC